MSDPDLDAVRRDVAAALHHAIRERTKRRLRQVLRELDGEPVTAQLVECRHCGRIGLPEQIREHEC